MRPTTSDKSMHGSLLRLELGVTVDRVLFQAAEYCKLSPSRNIIPAGN